MGASTLSGKAFALPNLCGLCKTNHQLFCFLARLEGKLNLAMRSIFQRRARGAVHLFHPVRGDMFIDRAATSSSGPVRRSGSQVELNHSSTIPLLRTGLVFVLAFGL
jgi:hypothetical protein